MNNKYQEVKKTTSTLATLITYGIAVLLLSSCYDHHHSPKGEAISPLHEKLLFSDVVCFSETHYVVESLEYLNSELPELVRHKAIDTFITESIPASLNNVLNQYLNDTNANNLDVEKTYFTELQNKSGWGSQPHFIPMLRTLWELKREPGQDFKVCGIDERPTDINSRETALVKNTKTCMGTAKKVLIHAGAGHCDFSKSNESFQSLISQISAADQVKKYISIRSGFIPNERMAKDNQLTLEHNLYYDLTAEIKPTSPIFISAQDIFLNYDSTLKKSIGRDSLVSRTDYILIAPYVAKPTWSYAVTLYNQLLNNGN